MLHLHCSPEHKEVVIAASRVPNLPVQDKSRAVCGHKARGRFRFGGACRDALCFCRACCLDSLCPSALGLHSFCNARSWSRRRGGQTCMGCSLSTQ